MSRSVSAKPTTSSPSSPGLTQRSLVLRRQMPGSSPGHGGCSQPDPALGAMREQLIAEIRQDSEAVARYVAQHGDPTAALEELSELPDV